MNVSAEPSWKQEMLWLTIAYRMLECGDSIPLDTHGTPYAFIEEDLAELHRREFIEIHDDQTSWRPTKRAELLRDRMVAMYDQVLKFEIFSDVNLGLELSADQSEDGMHVFDHLYDPRFLAPDDDADAERLGTEDMRLAMITYLGKCFAGSEAAQEELGSAGGEFKIDPHRVVFLQRLADGRLRDENIWFDLKLGTPFQEVEEIVSSAYRYTDVSDDPDEVDQVMQNIYTAGMLEARKREGYECTACEIPLAVFEMNAKEEGGTLTECPNPECKASFSPPPGPAGEAEYGCPNCESSVYPSESYCRGCGARLDFSRPPGTIVEETQEETYATGVWDGYYGYVPYGYYNPYDPFYDIAAFAVVAAVLW